MTAAQLLEKVQDRADLSEEEIADGLYAVVMEALKAGEERQRLRTALDMLYADLKARGCTKERRAVGEVLAAFDGWCAPGAVP